MENRVIPADKLTYKTFINWDYRYVVNYPADWEIADSWQGRLVAFLAPDSEPRMFVRIEIPYDYVPLDAFLESPFFCQDTQILNRNNNYSSFMGTLLAVGTPIYGQVYIMQTQNINCVLTLVSQRNSYGHNNVNNSELPAELQLVLNSFKLME